MYTIVISGREKQENVSQKGDIPLDQWEANN